VPTRSYESFGLVALEAMHASVPVVASNIEGLREVVDDGVTGRLVAPADPDALAAAVLEIIADPSRRDEMGRRGQLRARSHFDASRFADAYDRCFREAAG
jgi:glycosyltransferase involved in cell wall biosynthesis